MGRTDARQRSQTGSREIFESGAPHRRQSEGKTVLKSDAAARRISAMGAASACAARPRFRPSLLLKTALRTRQKSRCLRMSISSGVLPDAVRSSPRATRKLVDYTRLLRLRSGFRLRAQTPAKHLNL